MNADNLILCIGYGYDYFNFLNISSPEKEKETIAKFLSILEMKYEYGEITSLLSWGRFDVKFLKSRGLIHGLDVSILDKITYFDLLQFFRNAFNFESNKLTSVAKVMGIPNDDGFNGSDVPELWVEYLRTKDMKYLKNIESHCRKDLETLKAVYDRLKICKII